MVSSLKTSVEWLSEDMDQEKWIEQTIEELAKAGDEVTYNELLILLPDAEEHIELLDALLDELAAMGISVVDSKEEPEEEQADSQDQQSDLDAVGADDLLSLYLVDMSQEPLLTFEEEIELAQQIEKGKQAEKAIQETDYTAAEYDRLQAQVEAGQAAREHLGRANTRLVVSIAKRYRGHGVPFSDLIQNGNIGLMRAVDRYDYRRGNRFSTYATWWIRQAVTRSLANQGRVIRIPVHTGERMRKMAQVARQLEQELGQRPTPEEIAAEMGESPYKVREMMRWATQPLSLELPVGENDGTELGHFIEDENTPEPEAITDQHLLNETLDDLMKQLTPREARILRLRYGLQDGRTRTLSEVADKYDLSRERIRQLERQALLKLRLVAPDYRLQQFLEEH